jgi:hypothetical protein
VCAWTVAIATGSTERELQPITPSDRSAAGLARAGVDPLLALKICRAVLVRESSPDAENGLDHAATVQVLAHAAAHRPVLVVLDFTDHEVGRMGFDLRICVANMRATRLTPRLGRCRRR